MTFKKEISFDGVAIITGIILLTVWIATLKNNQDATAKTVESQGVELKEIHAILIQEQLKSEAMDMLRKSNDDHETRIRVLEKDADFLRLAH